MSDIPAKILKQFGTVKFLTLNVYLVKPQFLHMASLPGSLLETWLGPGAPGGRPLDTEGRGWHVTQGGIGRWDNVGRVVRH